MSKLYWCIIAIYIWKRSQTLMWRRTCLLWIKCPIFLRSTKSQRNGSSSRSITCESLPLPPSPSPQDVIDPRWPDLFNSHLLFRITKVTESGLYTFWLEKSKTPTIEALRTLSDYHQVKDHLDIELEDVKAIFLVGVVGLLIASVILPLEIWFHDNKGTYVENNQANSPNRESVRRRVREWIRPPMPEGGGMLQPVGSSETQMWATKSRNAVSQMSRVIPARRINDRCVRI